MFDWLIEYYRLNYDSNPGGGVTLLPNKTLGLTVGDERPMYLYDIEENENDDDIIIDDETLSAVYKKTKNSIVSKIDPKRSFPSHTSGNLNQSPSLYERSKSDHTNPTRKGISPYPQKKFTGPAIGAGSANQAFRTTGNYRRTGTLYGTSRATIFFDDDENFEFYDKQDDPMSRAFLKQQRKIRKIKKQIKQMNNKKNS